MKKDFAIICAANISKRNSGMYSVDLAAQQYFSGLGRSFDLCMTQGDGVVGSLRFRKLRTPEDYLDYKNIVYWGDFQNNPLWGANDYCNKEIAYEGVTDREIAFQNWANRYLLLPRMIGNDADVYAIGGSFMGAQEYLSDPAINQPFLYFLSSAKRIIVRDSASYRFLSALSHNPGILQGFDCAALLRMPAARKGSFFVYSFRRTIGKEDARRLVRAVEKATGFKGVAINWLGRKPRLRSPHGNFVRNSRLISQAQFALSDIYHFCINSFGRGTPALCIGTREGDFRSTLDDHKKFVLYEMLGSDSLIFDCRRDALSDETIGNICQAAGRFKSGDAGANALEAFQVLQDRFRAELDECFSR
ncbi:hypothetical protein F8A87_10365 [Betaproteobacteria bacterium SCN2]|jgi:hypothetical protein|nr:hypothetical protein F8A87_10365 [Betaproteobacteria bacterium SCN2]